MGMYEKDSDKHFLYYHKNRDFILGKKKVYKKKYYEKNKEKLLKQKKSWYQKNKKYILAKRALQYYLGETLPIQIIKKDYKKIKEVLNNGTKYQRGNQTRKRKEQTC